MPDWSYRTIFRPLLFRLPARTARSITLQAMGTLSKIPGGKFIIRTMGHMELSPILQSEVKGVSFKYPIGLSGELDPHGISAQALTPFGFGYYEMGPVSLKGQEELQKINRHVGREAIIYSDIQVNVGVQGIIQRLRSKHVPQIPIMLRTKHAPNQLPQEAAYEHHQLIQQLTSYASGYFIDAIDPAWTQEEITECFNLILQSAQAITKNIPYFIYVPLDYPIDMLEQLLKEIELGAWTGIVIGDYIHTKAGYVVSRDGSDLSIEKVKFIREWHTEKTNETNNHHAAALNVVQNNFVIIATAGIHEPQDSVDVMEAGADYVQLHSGLVYSGPGLPKRINEAIIYERNRHTAPQPKEPFWKSWGWMCLLGIGMIIGGILAWIIAATSVLLPYDVSYLGVDGSIIKGLNDKLLPFMSHDRVTLAGTMISIGVLYFQLGKYGLRDRQHWAKTALMTSGIVGFGSFFLYLGYGYFDPLHGLSAIILLPMFILSMRTRADRPQPEPVNLRNDVKWKLAQWGQLMFVTLGIALAVGGAVISFIGVTDVFVTTDLNFLHTSPEHLTHTNPHFMPLIAHDRAGFGGALLSDALAILGIALWGIGQGKRWLWWTLLFGGLPGFIAGFSVHVHIGYIDLYHLLPAIFAVLIYLLGLIFLYPYMMQSVNKEKAN